MSAFGYILFKTLASSYKTFLTMIFFVFIGKNFDNLLVVIQNDACVVNAEDLYFEESKKVKSNFLDLSKVFISLNFTSFLNGKFGNKLLIE